MTFNHDLGVMYFVKYFFIVTGFLEIVRPLRITVAK